VAGHTQLLTGSRLVTYGLPALAFAVPTIPVYVYLPSFYAEDLGLGLALTGTILLLVRILDVVSDPLVGLISDRLPTRYGRRKPWIALGGVAAAVALVALFTPPTGVSAFYLGFWSAVLYVGWTLIAVPYNAWGAELSDDYDQRTTITTVREGFGIAGILIAATLPFLLGLIGWDKAAQLSGMAWATVIAGSLLVAFALARVPEARQRRTSTSLSIRDMVRGLGQNAPFRHLVVAWFINGLANGLPAVLLPLFLKHWLEAGTTEAAGMILIYFAFAVLGLPLWLRLSSRTSKNRTWCAAMMAAIVAFIWVPMTGPENLWMFAVICAVTGVALGADLALPPAMQADVIDVDRARSGEERAGVYFALWYMAQKLALAVAVGIAFPILEWSGLEDGTSLGLVMLVFLYAGLPVLLKLLAFALIWRHPLDRAQQADLRRTLTRRTYQRET
jgi:Na+/melibiose symporter-like transporter